MEVARKGGQRKTFKVKLQSLEESARLASRDDMESPHGGMAAPENWASILNRRSGDIASIANAVGVVLGADGPTTITGAGAVAVSYPGFFEALDSLRA